MQELINRFLVIAYFAFHMAEFPAAQSIATQAFLEWMSGPIEMNSHNGQLNIRVFRELLRGIDYLNLHLFNERYFENSIVQQFLQQTYCPLQLSVGDMKEQLHFSQRHWALVMSSNELEMNLNKYVSREGVLINILLDQPDE